MQILQLQRTDVDLSLFSQTLLSSNPLESPSTDKFMLSNTEIILSISFGKKKNDKKQSVHLICTDTVTRGEMYWKYIVLQRMSYDQSADCFDD